MHRCRTCRGEEFQDASFTHHAHVGGLGFAVDVIALECTACGTKVVAQDVQQEADLAIAVQVAQTAPADGVAVRFLRKALKLTGAQLAQRLEITPSTVSRIENGRAGVDRATWVALGAMVRDALEGSPFSDLALKAYVTPQREGTFKLSGVVGQRHFRVQPAGLEVGTPLLVLYKTGTEQRVVAGRFDGLAQGTQHLRLAPMRPQSGLTPRLLATKAIVDIWKPNDRDTNPPLMRGLFGEAADLWGLPL